MQELSVKEVTTKICTTCHVEKDIACFYSRKRKTKDGLYSSCKSCTVIARKEYHRIHKDECDAYHAVYNRKRYHGVTPAEYESMLTRQNGVCAICGSPETKGKNKCLSVDHNHKTGRVRGLLCSSCNLALGQIDDNIRILQAMINYLRK